MSTWLVLATILCMSASIVLRRRRERWRGFVAYGGVVVLALALAGGGARGTAPLGAHPDLLLLNERSVNNWVVVNVDRRARTGTTFWAMQVALSHDGSYVALRSTNQVDVAAVDGTHQRTLTNVGGSYSVTSLDWAPTDDQLVYAVAAIASPVTGGVYVVRRDGRGRRRIADDVASEVRWSPDGSLIAFVVAAGQDASGDVYVMQPNGAGRRLVDTRNHGEPQPLSWSSDGRLLLSVHAQGEAASAAVVMDIPTGTRSLVPRAAAASFAPRGRRIVVVRGCHLYCAQMLTGSLTHLASVDATDVTPPVWASDGRRIAYTTTDGLWVSDLATRERHRVLAWQLRPVEAKFGLVWATAYP
jgi:Tol biopolymer transport system component